MTKLRIQHPIEFQIKANGYFDRQTDYKRPITMPGLARALGFSRKRTVWDYADKDGQHKEFNVVAQEAITRVEEYYNEALFDRKMPGSGPIFALKAEFKYDDKPSGPDMNINIKIDGIAAQL